MSVGTRAMFVNGGAPAPATPPGAPWPAPPPITTRCALPRRHPRNWCRTSASPNCRRGPSSRVRAMSTRASSRPTARWSRQRRMTATAKSSGSFTRATLVLSPNGRKLDWRRRLAGPRVRVRLRQDLPFAIHFHLHPEAGCKLFSGEKAAEIRSRDGQVWRFSGRKPRAQHRGEHLFRRLRRPARSPCRSCSAARRSANRISRGHSKP